MRPPNEKQTVSFADESRLVIKIAEAAKLLWISPTFADELAKRDELHIVHLGRREL